MPTIDLEKEEIRAIANTLNTEAGYLKSLCLKDDFSESTKTVWKFKAAYNRKLSKRLMETL